MSMVGPSVMLALSLLHAGTSGQTIYDSMMAKVLAANSVSIRVETTVSGRQGPSKDVLILRGGYFRYHTAFDAIDSTQYQTPTGGLLAMADSKQYQEIPARGRNEAVQPLEAMGLRVERKTIGSAIEDRLADRPMWRISLARLATSPPATLWVDRRSLMPIRVQYREGDHDVVCAVTKIELGVHATKEDFVWHPPVGWHRYSMDLSAMSGLLPVGMVAPSFELDDVAGVRHNLRGLLEGNKALLLNFWFIGCPTCRQEFPHLRDLYRRFGKSGLNVVAVNITDSAEAAGKFAIRENLGMPILIDRGSPKPRVSKLYKVVACPTTYLIASDGKIRASFVGYDREGLDTALANVGFRVR